MKVKELIKELSKLNPESPVCFFDHYWGNHVDVNVVIETNWKWFKEENKSGAFGEWGLGFRHDATANPHSPPAVFLDEYDRTTE